jgi:hypothetical protein
VKEMKEKKLKRLRRITRLLCFCGWAGCVILAMMSDANSISFFQIAIFSVLLVFAGLVFGIASAELTELIKTEESKLHGDYRKYGEDDHAA